MTFSKYLHKIYNRCKRYLRVLRYRNSTRHKEYSSWIKQKEYLSYRSQDKLETIKEGDVFWSAIGSNVGKEVDGKSGRFSRPVLVFKKWSEDLFLSIPTSTRINTKNEYKYKINLDGIEQVLIFNQARSLDTRRIYNKIGSLDRKELDNIKLKFIEYIKQYAPD